MTRPEPEIAAEIERWKAEVRQLRIAGRGIEATAATIIVSALSWAAGRIERPTHRVKIE